jgi:uncharacterized protein
MTSTSNHLFNEKSPYLQQHAKNPVNWYPWKEEAFQEAHRRDVPIFLSIGYSTCHWCHVMERESFEDDEIAKILNDGFVCIKVDREERPDIDATYMSVCQMLTGGGGWPLTILMTSEKEPFWAGTYLPKKSNNGMLGLSDLIPSIKSLWKNDRLRLVSDGAAVIDALTRYQQATMPTILNKDVLNMAYNQLVELYDDQFFGFGHSPKFPSPHNLIFLIRYWRRTHEKKAIEMVVNTLTAMYRGGIHDHLGGGFHRYSTDNKWQIPHFEKMLYDQATLLHAYSDAYQATRDPIFSITIRDVANYTLNYLTDPEGGFYSAEDADSEGQEGKFYTWTKSQISEILNEKEASIAYQIFGVSDEGNMDGRSGENVLYLKNSEEKFVDEITIKTTEYQAKIKSIYSKLLAKRNNRARPFLDDKILTDWNGLMIAALSRAGVVLNEINYITAAEKSANFILNNMHNGELLHRYRLGEASIPAFLDDYAYLIWGLIELYEATFNAKYLEEAKRLTEKALQLFWDSDSGGFYIAGSLEDSLPRVKETYDGAKPSGNSVMAMNLLRLGRGLERNFESMAEKLLSALSATVRQNPISHTYLLCALDYYFGPSYEVVLVGNNSLIDTSLTIDAIRGIYSPNQILMLKTASLNNLLGYTSEMKNIDEKPTIYICQNRICKLPTTNIEEAIKTLGSDYKF